jgi:hypothetical protein
MHEVAVMKAVPVAGTTVPGCYTATVPRGHVPGPCAHPGAACNCKTAAATPATSHVTSATASMTVSHGERGYQYNRERNQESAHLTLPCLVSDKKNTARRMVLRTSRSLDHFDAAFTENDTRCAQEHRKFGIVGFQSKSHALNAAASINSSIYDDRSKRMLLSLNTCSWNE